MCGIFAVHGNSQVATKFGSAVAQTIRGLQLLEYRGYDSWGVAWQVGKQLQVHKQVGMISRAQLQVPESRVAIGHTRWATHGGVTELNAHPHFDCHQSLAVVQNGIVENWQALKAELEAQGHRFISQTDTEVIAHLIEESAKNMSIENALRQAFSRLEGLNAVAVLEAQSGKLLAIKHGSPLVVGRGAAGIYVASDVSAMADFIEVMAYLADDIMVELQGDQIVATDVPGHVVSLQFQKPELNANMIEKGKFPYYLLKEISEQPQLVTGLLTRRAELESFAAQLTEGTALVGCGTAYHACLAGQKFLRSLAGIECPVMMGSEYEATSQRPVLFVSQSGETIDITERAGQAHQRGQTVLALVNRYHSTLENLADQTFLLKAGPEMSVLATKSFLLQVSVFLLIAAIKAGIIDTVMADLAQAGREMNHLLTPEFAAEYLTPLAQKYNSQKNWFVIGRHWNYPLALETALKLKEGSYLHAEGLASGELKHGPLALITQGTPCLVISSPETAIEDQSNAREVKARGGHLIGLTTTPNEVFDEVIPIGTAGTATSLVAIVALQLLAYHLAISLGLDPDRPRNIAKTVTVK